MFRPSTFFLAALLAFASVHPAHGALAERAAGKIPALPKTPDELRERLGKDYEYIDRDELLIVSDLDKKTLYQLTSRDFLIYLNVLKRDFYDKPRQPGRSAPQPILTVFLFQNRETYVQGLRKIGFDLSDGDGQDQNAVRNGYYYSGRNNSFILINYRDAYEQGISTYAHELSHALMLREIPRPPSWINEGIATMVGHSMIVNSHLKYNNDSGLKRLRRALKNDAAPSLSRLMEATGQEYSSENSTPYYDAGEQFCRFLHSRNQLLPVYRDLRDGAKKRETPEKVIARVTGLGLNNLEKEWHAWMAKQ